MFFVRGRRGAGWWLARRATAMRIRVIASQSPGAPPAYNLLLNKYYVDEGYDYVFTGRKEIGDLRLGAMGLGEAASLFDSRIIDGAVNNVGRFTRLTGHFLLVGQVDH